MRVRGVVVGSLLVGGAAACWLDALLGGRLVDQPPVVLAVALLGYAVGAWTTAGWGVATVIAAAAGLTAANQMVAAGEYHPIDDLVFFLVLVGAPALAGAAFIARRRQVRELTVMTERLSAQRDAAVRAARLREQNRIGAELHRDVTEQFAAIVMRAEGAQRAATPDEARRALVDVEATARASLDQLRATLGTLREPTTRGPVPMPKAEAGPVPEVGPVHGAVDHLDHSERRNAPERPHWTDVALAVACGLAVAVEAVVSEHARGPAWADVAAGLLVAAPLAWRRTRPLVSASLVMIIAAAMSAVVTPFPLLVTAIALLLVTAYSVGAYSRRWPLGALVLVAGVALVTFAAPADARDADGLLPSLVFVVLALTAGLVGAGSIRRAGMLREGVAELESGREVDVQLAIAEQRHRLAQELHDTVAHAMTVVCLQASAGDRTGDIGVLDTILLTSRRGLVELRDGLSALDLDVLDPDGIRAEARRAGLVATARVDLDVDDLAPEVALLASRVVREALVNAGRYAAGAAVRVRLEREGGPEPGAFTVEVVDDGGASDFTHGSGSGLTGLAEQVAAAGGRLVWGASGTGFRVHATLPLEMTVGTP